jgi:catechol 2,3-dioxygenase-like lactoylglutathione lyase family enzyme
MTTETTSTSGQSAVEFATATRVHVSINVREVERSLPFYQTLFGQAPTKVRPGYAKFEVAEPPVNFTLNENATFQPGGTLSLFGIQVKSTAEVVAAKERFIESGLATFDEDNVTCCYAVQDKVWVTDPDGNQWEAFVVLDADAPVHSISQEGESSCACSVADMPGTGKQPISLVGAGAASKCC